MDNYLIEKANSLMLLEQRVQRHIENGYVPCGGPVVLDHSCVQALWRKPMQLVVAQEMQA